MRGKAVIPKAETLKLLLVDFEHQSKAAKWEISGS
jgi:hypothetical protein